MKTCFSIMQFNDDFNDIDEIICKAAKKCGLVYVRGDLSKRPGSVMPQILHEIRRASVVVVDITGHNPNVFYELGIAHQIKGPERVVIITRELDGKKAFDIHQYRQFVYTHDKEGRAKLRNELPKLILEASESNADQEFWNVIKGRLPRTRLIIRDLNRLVDTSDPEKLKNTTIRIVAAMSSIAISNNEPPDAKLGLEYQQALRDERDALRKALLKGVDLKAVLNPPRHFTPAMSPGRLSIRYKRLIGLLNNYSDIKVPKIAREDLKAMKQCDFVISPVPLPNLLIIGNEVAYEGMKRGGKGGFDMTHCETNPEGLQDLIRDFDGLFEESGQEMRRLHPDESLADILQGFYNEATAKGVSL